MIDFRTEPSCYRHWRITFTDSVANLVLSVDEAAPLVPGYDLKLNSYDLGVDIELNDAVQRLRFEHPEIKSVIICSANDRVFSAGANIRMLAQASHPFKVNFCKFTNETRMAIEDATANSGQFYITAINGACAGGGYELALATSYIIMADDGSTAVSLPELPLLAVLPGTGGLTRLVDKRGVRRDHADFLCTTEEGLRGQRAVEWRLIDEVVAKSRLRELALARALEFGPQSDRPAEARGLKLDPLERKIEEQKISYSNLTITLDREKACAFFDVTAPDTAPPADISAMRESGCRFWPLAFARSLEDAILHLRFNEESIRSWVFRTKGDPAVVSAYDTFMIAHGDDWLVREIRLFVARTLRRLDVTSRSLFAFIEPGSCFAGTLFELILAADRSYMLRGSREGDDTPAPRIAVNEMNFGAVPMYNRLTRLQTRFLGRPDRIEELRSCLGTYLTAEVADKLGLVTFTPDDLDWDDETRLALEERAAFSSDALTGMEASLRFAGPETMETKIFARLSAWQNWIFQRPNAIGENGALKLYGSGKRPEFDRRSV